MNLNNMLVIDRSVYLKGQIIPNLFQDSGENYSKHRVQIDLEKIDIAK
jgi:hypothetical protein